MLKFGHGASYISTMPVVPFSRARSVGDGVQPLTAGVISWVTWLDDKQKALYYLACKQFCGFRSEPKNLVSL